MVFPVFPRNIPYRARPKTPPFHFFSALRDFFSRKKNFPQRVPPAFFLMFCDRMDVEKAQRVPLSVFFGIVRFFPENDNFCFLHFFYVLRQNGCWKTSKPLSVFRHCETLARQGLALASPGAPLGPFFWVCNFFEKFFFKKFRFSSTVKEYLTLGSLFAIFEPWIWRRLGPVPACFLNHNFVAIHAHIFW